MQGPIDAKERHRFVVFVLQIEGCLFLEYNLGQKDHRIGELLHRINNDVYHVVNFLRSGANATVYLDNHLIYSYTASGEWYDIIVGLILILGLILIVGLIIIVICKLLKRHSKSDRTRLVKEYR